MFKRLNKRKIATHAPLIVLILISIYLAIANYEPNTFLTGWDTLHPEFNFSIYWERIFKGAWQDHQALGTVATQAHSAEIPRIILMQVLSWFFSVDKLRYLYMFLMMIIGPIGFYFFIFELFPERKNTLKAVAASIGGLYYLLNLSTLQHFYIPLEMFPTHFGYLGWHYYFVMRVLRGKKRAVLSLFLVSFISSPQAHTSTLFIAFIATLAFYLFLNFLITSKEGKKIALVRSALIAFIIFAANLFWLGPNLYFIATEAKSVSESKIHFLFSEEAILQNQSFGNIKDTAVLKGFLFNWGEHIGNGAYGDLLGEWNSYYFGTPALFVGYMFFVFVLIGVVLAVLRKNKTAAPFIGVLFLSYVFVASRNPPTGFIYSFLQTYVPLFKEAFRFPFTKFSTLLAFSYSIFISYFFLDVTALLGKIRDVLVTRVAVASIYVVSVFLLIYFMAPAFNGYYISPSMRVNIPDRYFEMFDYLNEQEDYGRVANFPIHSMWGWVYNNWDPITKLGYQGAGFTWFGIKQPLMDREFDRWGSNNEQYYREMSYAVYTKDLDLVEKLLNKYQIKWILIDKSIIQPGADNRVLYIDEIENMLEESELASLAKHFSPDLYIYEIANDYEHVAIYDDVSLVGRRFLKESYDPIYVDEGMYINLVGNEYPFVGITNTDESLLDNNIWTDEEKTVISLPKEVPGLSPESTPEFIVGFANLVFTRNSEEGGNILLDTTDNNIMTVLGEVNNNTILGVNSAFYYVDSSTDKLILGQAELGKEIKIDLYERIGSLNVGSFEEAVLEPCSSVGTKSSYTVQKIENGIELSAKNTRVCLTMPLSSVIEDYQEQEEFVLSMHVKTQSEDDAIGELCLFDDRFGECLGTYDSDGHAIRMHTDLSVSDMGHYYIRIFSNSGGSEEISISYKDLTYSYYVYADSLVIDVDDEIITNESLVFNKELVLDSSDLAYFSNPQNCGSSNRDLRGDSVSYSSGLFYQVRREFVCDSFPLNQLKSNQGYLVEVRSKNIYGPSLRMCVSNMSTSRCDLYVSLPKSTEEEMVTSYYFLPPTVGSRYTLNLTGLVFGKYGESENKIDYISFTPVPYKSLRHTKLSYEPETYRVVVLSESFNKGWIPFCGIKPCQAEHVYVNNWANGWVLDQDYTENDIVFIFWPQLVQYAGYLILVVTMITLILGETRRKKNTNL